MDRARRGSGSRSQPDLRQQPRQQLSRRRRIAGDRRLQCQGTPSRRWAVPVAATPADAVRIDTSTSSPGTLPECNLSYTVSERAAALDAQRQVDALTGRSGSVA